MSGKKQHNGFSLRVFNFWMVVAAVIMTALMVYSIYRLSSSFLRMTHATESHIAMVKAATKLMDASDYLTEKAQRFAGTGNMQFLEEYFTEAKESTRREKALDKMKSDFAELQNTYAEKVELLDKYESEPDKMEIIISTKYSYVADTKEFNELRENHFDLSVAEVTNKANEILLSYAESGSLKFAAEEGHKENFRQIPYVKAEKKTGRYGNLFSK